MQLNLINFRIPSSSVAMKFKTAFCNSPTARLLFLSPFLSLSLSFSLFTFLSSLLLLPQLSTLPTNLGLYEAIKQIFAVADKATPASVTLNLRQYFDIREKMGREFMHRIRAYIAILLIFSDVCLRDVRAIIFLCCQRHRPSTYALKIAKTRLN